MHDLLQFISTKILCKDHCITKRAGSEFKAGIDPCVTFLVMIVRVVEGPSRSYKRTVQKAIHI